MHGFAITRDDTAGKINPHITKGDQRRSTVPAPTLPAQQGACPGAQFADTKRFGQVIIRTDVERLDLVSLVRACLLYTSRCV